MPPPPTAPARARRSRRLVAAALAALLSVGTAACAGDDAPSAGPQTLRVAFAEPVGVLDPHAFTGHFIALDLVYEPLVEYGPGGELLPGLATSWEVAADGLTVTFHLRQGVRFHDGTAFDAAAVKWNFDRWVGKPDFGFFRSSTAIREVAVVDPATVALHLTEPYAPLLAELAIGRPVRLLSPASAPDGPFATPVGTGPWKFESASETGGEFVRNDDYWGERPTLERLEVVVIPDAQTRVAALRSGQVDLLGGAYMAPIGNVEATALRAGGIDVLAGDADTTLLLGFNRAGIPGDQAVRRAISLATDVAGINQVLYGGASDVAGGFFPPSIKDAGDVRPHTFDLGTAADTLEAAGWTAGDGGTRHKDGVDLSLRLLLVGDAAHGQQDSTVTGQALADALTTIGIDVTIDGLDGAAYFDALSRGEYDLAFFTTYGAPYDPSSSVTAFLHTGGGEAPIWNDDELDTLVDGALFARDDAAATEAYRAIFDHLAALDAIVAITHPPRFYAAGPRVHGFEVPPSEYDLPLQGVTVEP